MPDLSIITNIGFDHTQFLGNTLPLIAGEKAGIIKPGVPVVIGETHPETRPVFEQKAAEMGAPIYFADDRYRIIAQPEPPSLQSSDLRFTVEKMGIENGELRIENYPSAAANSQFSILNSQFTGDTPAQFSILNSQFTCPLSGSYQLKNLATLFQALELLPTVGYTISPDNIRNGIARVVQDTGLHGRWEKMDEHPLTICETAHNADGVRAMLQNYGCVNDKDFRSILQMLPHDRTTYYYTQPSVPRALPVAQLAEAAASCGMAGESFSQVADAIRAARANADPRHDLVLVIGSIFLVADAVEHYMGNKVLESKSKI